MTFGCRSSFQGWRDSGRTDSEQQKRICKTCLGDWIRLVALLCFWRVPNLQHGFSKRVEAQEVSRVYEENHQGFASCLFRTGNLSVLVSVVFFAIFWGHYESNLFFHNKKLTNRNIWLFAGLDFCHLENLSISFETQLLLFLQWQLFNLWLIFKL